MPLVRPVTTAPWGWAGDRGGLVAGSGGDGVAGDRAVPPSSAGAVQVTVAWVLPFVAVTPVGAPGRVASAPSRRSRCWRGWSGSVIRASPSSAPPDRVSRRLTHGSGVAGSRSGRCSRRRARRRGRRSGSSAVRSGVDRGEEGGIDGEHEGQSAGVGRRARRSRAGRRGTCSPEPAGGGSVVGASVIVTWPAFGLVTSAMTGCAGVAGPPVENVPPAGTSSWAPATGRRHRRRRRRRCRAYRCRSASGIPGSGASQRSGRPSRRRSHARVAGASWREELGFPGAVQRVAIDVLGGVGVVGRQGRRS